MEVCLPLFASLKETLAMMTVNVAKYGDCQQKLRSEIMSAVKDSKYKLLDYDRVMQLPYLEAFIKESMRLNPPITRLRRLCRVNDQLIIGDDNEISFDHNIDLIPGDRVDISVVGVQTSGQFYDQPFQFNPQRFMPENRCNINANTFLGFSIGPQICFGNRFSFLVIKTFLATMITKYQFKCPDNNQLKFCENVEIAGKTDKLKVKFELIAN